MIPSLNFPLYVTKEAYSFFNGVKGHGCFLVCLKTSCPLAMNDTNWENTKLIETIWQKKAYKLKVCKINVYKLNITTLFKHAFWRKAITISTIWLITIRITYKLVECYDNKYKMKTV